MALLRDFDYDVFISYAHYDNPPGFMGEQQPIDRIVDFLKSQLQMRVGARGKYEVFYDNTHLGAGDEIEQVLPKVRRSAVFVSIVSPSYIADKSWALRELAAFCDLEGSEDRLLMLELLPVFDRDDTPDVLKARKAHKFWEAGGSQSATNMTLDPIVHRAEYRVQLTSFADQVSKKIERLLKDQGSATPPSEPEEPIGTVLLTQANDDVEFERVQVASYLSQANVRVLPEYDYPQGGEDFKAAFAEDLAEADVVVQLLGRSAGKMPRDLPEGYQRHQHHAALDAGKPLMAWRHPELDPETAMNPIQRELLESAKTMAEGLQTFKDEVLAKLTEPPPVQSPVFNGADGTQSPMIFLHAHTTDKVLAHQLRDALKARNMPVALPIFEDEVTEDLTAEERKLDLDENLQTSAKIVVVQGKVKVTWVRANLNYANRARAQRDVPPQLTALYKGPPPPSPDPNVWLPDLVEIDNTDGIDLDHFCAVLQNPPGTTT